MKIDVTKTSAPALALKTGDLFIAGDLENATREPVYMKVAGPLPHIKKEEANVVAWAVVLDGEDAGKIVRRSWINIRRVSQKVALELEAAS